MKAKATVRSSKARPATFYKAKDYCAQESVGFLMKRVLMAAVQQADRRLEPLGLTSAQWGPLLKLQMTDGATVAELAAWANIDASAMTRMLDRLENKGLCRRVRSTQDRRVVKVEITPEGREAISGVPAALAEVMNALLTGFSQEEWLTLVSLLKRMIANGEALREQG